MQSIALLILLYLYTIGKMPAYICDAVAHTVYIHPTSALFMQRPAYVIYHHLQQGKTRTYMHGVTIIAVEW